MVLQFLRRQTRQPTGIATGGGETGFDPQPQPHIFSKRLTTAKPVQTVALPKGTLIFGTFVAPVAEAPATAGTVQITNTTAASNLFGAAPNANTLAKAALAAAVRLTVDSVFTFTATGLAANTAVDLGIEIVLPRIRQ